MNLFIVSINFYKSKDTCAKVNNRCTYECLEEETAESGNKTLENEVEEEDQNDYKDESVDDNVKESGNRENYLHG